MNDPDWETIVEPANEAAAQIVLGLLASDGIPGRIVSNVPVPGLGISFRVQVEIARAADARAALAAASVTDDELTELALRSPPADSE
jgi:GMP synthase PP-ATPase subunit